MSLADLPSGIDDGRKAVDIEFDGRTSVSGCQMAVEQLDRHRREVGPKPSSEVLEPERDSPRGSMPGGFVRSGLHH